MTNRLAWAGCAMARNNHRSALRSAARVRYLQAVARHATFLVLSPALPSCAAWATSAWRTRRALRSPLSRWTTPSPSCSCRVGIEVVKLGSPARHCISETISGCGDGQHECTCLLLTLCLFGTCSMSAGPVCPVTSFPQCTTVALLSVDSAHPCRRGVPQGRPHQQGDGAALRALWTPRVLHPRPVGQEGGAGERNR